MLLSGGATICVMLVALLAMTFYSYHGLESGFGEIIQDAATGVENSTVTVTRVAAAGGSL